MPYIRDKEECEMKLKDMVELLSNNDACVVQIGRASCRERV